MEQITYNEIMGNLRTFIENPNKDYLIKEMIQSDERNNQVSPFIELDIILKNPGSIFLEDFNEFKQEAIKSQKLNHSNSSTSFWEDNIKDSMSVSEASTQYLDSSTETLASRLEKIIQNTKDNYILHEFIQYLVDSRDIPKDSEVYTKANLSKSYWSNLINGKKTNPSKNKLLRLAITLKLNNSELDKLLVKAGYSLKDNARDSALHMLFQNKIYDIEAIEDILAEFNLESLYDKQEAKILGVN